MTKPFHERLHEEFCNWKIRPEFELTERVIDYRPYECTEEDIHVRVKLNYSDNTICFHGQTHDMWTYANVYVSFLKNHLYELKTYEKRIEPWVEKANIALKARPPSSFPDFLSLLNTIFRIEKEDASPTVGGNENREERHLLNTQDVPDDEWGHFKAIADIEIIYKDKSKDTKSILKIRDVHFEVKWDATKQTRSTVRLSVDPEVGRKILREYNPKFIFISCDVSEEDRYFVKKSYRFIRFSRRHGFPKWMVPFSWAMLIPSLGVTSLFLYKGKHWCDATWNVFDCVWLTVVGMVTSYDSQDHEVSAKSPKLPEPIYDDLAPTNNDSKNSNPSNNNNNNNSNTSNHTFSETVGVNHSNVVVCRRAGAQPGKKKK